MARQRRLLREQDGTSDVRSSRDYKKLRGSSKQAKKSIFDSWTNKIAMFVSFNIIVLILSTVYFFYQHYLENRVITPLNVPRVVTKTGLSVPSLYWGTYRPGLYFGLQTRSDPALAMGLMWFSQKIIDNGIKIRHWCEQWNQVKKYGWQMHDAENFGIQEIEDEDFNITTSFIKNLGGEHGGDFTAKISVTPRVNSFPTPVSLIFYALSPDSSSLQPYVMDNDHLSEIYGYLPSLGKFRISFYPMKAGSMLLKYNYLNTKVQDHTAHLKETVLRNLALFQSKGKYSQILGLMGEIAQDPANKKGNQFLAHQVTFIPPFDLEVYFESESYQERTQAYTGPAYETKLRRLARDFEARFEEVFQLKSRGYSEENVKTAQATLSNMVGGMGYFYGSSLVQSNYNKAPISYWSAPLYTAVPSRSFFPRGFLWDEGFHNLLILKWNPEITKDIIGHWLDLMNIDGWIPREQILGLEARERVPSEFIVQKDTNANPPTFFLTLDSLLRGIKAGTIPDDVEFFQRVLPRLKTWFQWFNKTQSGMLPGTYRWRGRDYQTNSELNPKTLTSGLDDYPRASHPTIDERHIDLRCWIAFSSKVFADISDHIGESSKHFRATAQYLYDNQLLDMLHWSPSSQSYSDYGFHSTDVELVKQALPVPPGSREPPKTIMVRVTNEQPVLQYIDNFGYVSLFPFLLQIIDSDNPKLRKVLDDLKNPHLLWTPFGLRSLAQRSPYYMKYNTEHDPPYWRGPIWININYLAVRALHHYGQVSGPYQKQSYELYKKLKKNVVNNILKEYNRTGYIWEQYNDKTGRGQGSHPFTGWSSLYVLMMSELY